MTALLLAAALAASPVRADLRARPSRLTYNMPVAGPGPFVNFLDGDQAAQTNASAHVAWAIAIPLLGERIGGRKGLWIAGVGWMVETLVQEAFFHAPPSPGPSYASEVRSDLITRLVPTAIILVIDLLKGERTPPSASDSSKTTPLADPALAPCPGNQPDEVELDRPVPATRPDGEGPVTEPAGDEGDHLSERQIPARSDEDRARPASERHSAGDGQDVHEGSARGEEPLDGGSVEDVEVLDLDSEAAAGSHLAPAR